MKALSTKLERIGEKPLCRNACPLLLSNIDEEPFEDLVCFLSLSPKPLIPLLHHGYGVPFTPHKLLPWVSPDGMWRITRLILKQGYLSSEWGGLDISMQNLVICVKTWWKQTYLLRRQNLRTLSAAEWADLITLAPVSPSREEVPLGVRHWLLSFDGCLWVEESLRN